MEIKDYQEKASRTCASLGNEKLDLAHMALGVVSEIEELMMAFKLLDYVNVKEELADICWYIANYCTFRGYDFEDLIKASKDFEFDGVEGEMPTITFFSSILSDYVKKYIAYDKPIDKALERKVLITILHGINNELVDFSFEVDLERNIKKLEARYPDKFTNESALNRDLDIERKILES